MCLGTCYLDLCKNEEALKYWQMAVDLENDPAVQTDQSMNFVSKGAAPNARLELARCYFWKLDHSKVIEIFEQHNEMGEGELEFVGSCYRKLGQHKNAIAVYTRHVTAMESEGKVADAGFTCVLIGTVYMYVV